MAITAPLRSRKVIPGARLIDHSCAGGGIAGEVADQRRSNPQASTAITAMPTPVAMLIQSRLRRVASAALVLGQVGSERL